METNNVDSILNSIFTTSYMGDDDKFLRCVKNKMDAAYFFTDETVYDYYTGVDYDINKLALSLPTTYIPILFKDSKEFFKDITSACIYTKLGQKLILMFYDQFVGELNDEEFIKFSFEHEVAHMTFATEDEILADINAFKCIGYSSEKCDKIYRLITELVVNIGGNRLEDKIDGIKKRKKAIIKAFETK